MIDKLEFLIAIVHEKHLARAAEACCGFTQPPFRPASSSSKTRRRYAGAPRLETTPIVDEREVYTVGLALDRVSLRPRSRSPVFSACAR
jgi:hypothetical protein